MPKSNYSQFDLCKVAVSKLFKTHSDSVEMLDPIEELSGPNSLFKRLGWETAVPHSRFVRHSVLRPFDKKGFMPGP
jgi:hypothetical protein